MTASRWAKLDRAKSQIEALDHQIGDFATDQEPIGVREKFEADQQAWVGTVVTVPECPSDWGLMIGEIVHNLRGALDHLVWDLAILELGAEPIDANGRPLRIQFPICEDKARWKSSGFDRMIAPLNAVHRALIEGRQPYNGWNGPRKHPLLVLEGVSNADKHRKLRPAVLAPQQLDVGSDFQGKNCRMVSGEGGIALIGSCLEPNTVLFRIPIEVTGPNPEMEVRLKLSISIGLDDGMPIHDGVFDMESFVRETLAMFEADLTTPSALATRERIAATHRAAPGWLRMRWVDPPAGGDPPHGSEEGKTS